MGFDTDRIDVDDSEPVQLGAGLEGDAHMLRNLGPDTVLLGDEDVTAETGFPLEVGEAWPMELRGSGDKVFGICADGDTAEIAKAVNS